MNSTIQSTSAHVTPFSNECRKFDRKIDEFMRGGEVAYVRSGGVSRFSVGELMDVVLDGECVTSLIEKVTHFPSLEALIASAGHGLLVPGATSYDEVLSIYRGFYPADYIISTGGVCLLVIKKVVA